MKDEERPNSSTHDPDDDGGTDADGCTESSTSDNVVAACGNGAY